MKLVVGLGNPGIEYQFTPHNAGFLAVDRIAETCGAVVSNRRNRALTARVQLAGQAVLLAKPETFMNLSGLSVAELIKTLNLENLAEDLIVLYDELDLPLGRIQIKQNGSANGHNGIKSILASLGTPDWVRIRIGVGKPSLEDGRQIKSGGQSYLLAPMRKPDLAILDEVLDRAQLAVEAILTRGIAAAMNEFNRKPDTPKNPDEGKK